MSALKIIFGGAGPFAEGAFETLLDSPEIVVAAVVTRPDKPAGRGRRLQAQRLSALAGAKGLPVFKFQKIGAPAALEALRGTGATAFLTASYGQKLPSQVLALFPQGCWNLHPSLLPAYRGASPVPGALLDGKKITGVTLFKMVEAMDAGPIVACHATEIEDEENAGTLLQRLAHRAGLLGRSALPYAVRGHLPLDEQDAAAATYAPKLNKNDGLIDFSRDAFSLHNRIRAVTPWPGAFCTFRGESLHLSGSMAREAVERLPAPGTVLGLSPEGLQIACGQGILVISQFQRPGKRWMTAQDFANGARVKTGDRL